MIDFAREEPEPEDDSPRPLLMVGPQVQTHQTPSNLPPNDVVSGMPESVIVSTAKEQQELAMLQRALAQCGLI